MKKEVWYEKVADFICKILFNIDDEDYTYKILDAIDFTEKDTGSKKNMTYNEELEKLYQKDADVEKAAYKVLGILKEIIKENESKINTQ